MGTPARQIGIYKITSPSGKVYIGQSWDILGRFRRYKSLASVKKQVKLYNSLAKYGYDSHVFEIVKLHNDDVSQEELDSSEILYIKLYKEQGVSLMNIREGGSGGKLSKQSVEKMLITRGKWNHTEEARLKISKSHFGINHTKESREKISTNNKRTRILLNLETGIFYNGIEEASLAHNLTKFTLYDRLRGRIKNNTNLIYT